MRNKLKGIILIIFGIVALAFVYRHDTLLARPTHFGGKAILSFCISLIAVVNGIRLYLRGKNENRLRRR